MSVPDLAAIAGTFSDLKLVKTRSVAQLVVEIPIEEAQRAIEIFGIPQPGKEVPVALARLQPPVREEATRQPNAAASERGQEHYRQSDAMEQARTRAVLLCKDIGFRKWIVRDIREVLVASVDMAGDLLKQELGIKSRSEIASNEEAFRKFLALELSYKQSQGQFAEQRG